MSDGTKQKLSHLVAQDMSASQVAARLTLQEASLVLAIIINKKIKLLCIFCHIFHVLLAFDIVVHIL